MAGIGQEVYVKLPSGMTVTLEVKPSDKVSDLAAHVASKVHVGFMRLKYQGKVLKPYHTVGYLGIRVETILKAEEVPMRKLLLNVNVKQEDAEDVTTAIRVDNFSPLKDITERLKENGVSLPAGSNILKHGSEVLSNMDELLVDTGITDGATLDLTIKKLTATSRSNGSSTEKEDNYDDSDLAMVANTFDAGNRPVEVVFSFDTTGSMYSCLARVRERLQEACTRLLNDIPQLRIGIIAHGDYCDHRTYVLRSIDLTRDVNSLTDFVSNVPATGGGDSPECYEWALRKGQQLDWAEDSAKALVVIGDATPHCVSYTDQRINWHDELDVLCGMGVKVYGVQALNQSESTDFYKQLAEKSGGAYIKFSNFKVITDMFLAVCYREADEGGDVEEGAGQLAAFMEELEQEGRLEGEVNDVLQQVAQHAPAQPVAQRYNPADWWDPSKDHGRCQYKYDTETDSWTYYTENPTPTSSPSSSVSRPVRRSKSLKSKISTKKCAIM